MIAETVSACKKAIRHHGHCAILLTPVGPKLVKGLDGYNLRALDRAARMGRVLGLYDHDALDEDWIEDDLIWYYEED